MALYLLKPSEMATAWLFGGLPRSGKSYHAALIARRWLRSGGHVVSNMQLKIPSGFRGRAYRGQYRRLESGRDFVRDVQEFRTKFDGHILLILDEAASIFDSRDFKNFPPDVRALLAQHAKMRISLITICHGHDMVDASFRKLAGFYVEHLSISRSAGFVGLLSGLFFPGLMFRSTKAIAAGELVGKAYEKKFYFGRQRVYDFYDTFQIAEGSFRGSEDLKKAIVRGFGWKRKIVFGLAIWALLRFTPFNAPPLPASVAMAGKVKPVVTLSGEIGCYNMDSGVCDLITSQGDIFTVRRDPAWGLDPVEIVGRFATIDVWSTSPALQDRETSERLQKYVQKK